MTYLNKRGGKIILEDVKTPPRQEWGTAEEAFQAALQLERDVNEVSYFCFPSSSILENESQGIHVSLFFIELFCSKKRVRACVCVC